jgi:uncharacterized membrane protein
VLRDSRVCIEVEYKVRSSFVLAPSNVNICTFAPSQDKTTTHQTHCVARIVHVACDAVMQSSYSIRCGIALRSAGRI